MERWCGYPDGLPFLTTSNLCKSTGEFLRWLINSSRTSLVSKGPNTFSSSLRRRDIDIYSRQRAKSIEAEWRPDDCIGSPIVHGHRPPTLPPYHHEDEECTNAPSKFQPRQSEDINCCRNCRWTFSFVCTVAGVDRPTEEPHPKSGPSGS